MVSIERGGEIEASPHEDSPAQTKYHAQRWLADAKLTRYAALVALVLHPLGGLTDYAIIGWDARLVPLLALRLVAGAIHLPIVLICRKPRAPAWIESLLAAAFLLSALAGVLMPALLRPTSVASQGGPLLLLIVLYALVFPAWRSHKILIFLLTSAAYVAIGLYWRAQIGYGASHELITISLFLTAMGTLIPRVNRRIEQTEYERFMAEDELTHMVVRLKDEILLREERECALEEARSEAERASLAKSSFMASVSHELRTPLVGILGVTELMHGPSLRSQDEVRERLELLRQSGDLMLELVNDLLDYFKLGAGKLSLRTVPLSLRVVSKAAMDLVKPRADKRGLTLRHELEPSLPEWILGDAVRLQQLILNLVGNAVKFTDAGFVSLSLSRELAEPEPARLLIEVRDTGVGMAPSFVARMFEPFEQAERTSDRVEGSGLGLAITRHIVEQMGGTIEVETAVDEGTTIRVRLPLTPAQAPESSAAALLGTSGSSWPSIQLRVLIGEDNRVNAMVLVAMLEAMGHRVTLAMDGRELVDHAARDRFDIVLTDLRMPKLDGIEVTRCLRAMDPPRNSLPILALTADAFEEHHVALREAGIDEVLVKPLSSLKLDAALRRHASSASA